MSIHVINKSLYKDVTISCETIWFYNINNTLWLSLYQSIDLPPLPALEQVGVFLQNPLQMPLAAGCFVLWGAQICAGVPVPEHLSVFSCSRAVRLCASLLLPPNGALLARWAFHAAAAAACVSGYFWFVYTPKWDCFSAVNKGLKDPVERNVNSEIQCSCLGNFMPG